MNLLLLSVAWALHEAPPVARHEPVVGLLFVGDTGTGEPPQHQVAAAMAAWCATERCDAVALLGDNFYPAGVLSKRDKLWRARFEEVYAALDLPFRPVLGNHDYLGKPEAELRYHSRRWLMPARSYAWSLGEGVARLFGVDTETFSSTAAAELRAALDASTAPWNIVYGHFPVYSGGAHGNDPALEAQIEPALAGKADFYLCGHDHDQQVIAAPDGVVHVVSGGGGAGLRAVAKLPTSLYAQSTHGFGHLLLSATAARVRMVSATGEVGFDQTWAAP